MTQQKKLKWQRPVLESFSEIEVLSAKNNCNNGGSAASWNCNATGSGAQHNCTNGGSHARGSGGTFDQSYGADGDQGSSVY